MPRRENSSSMPNGSPQAYKPGEAFADIENAFAAH
jgi:hypothetical protein